MCVTERKQNHSGLTQCSTATSLVLFEHVDLTASIPLSLLCAFASLSLI